MKVLSCALALSLLAVPAFANDTVANLEAGGLVFVANDKIEMTSEHLFVSPSQIKVTYEFTNTTGEDQHLLVAFPMPDVEGSVDFMTDVWSADGDKPDPSNLFGFETLFNGKPVDAELHQYAFRNNVDYSALLTKMGVPLVPFGTATADALLGLKDDDVAQLRHLALVDGYEYDAGNGPETDIQPVWTLKSTYTWEATFPPGKSEVIHTYHPSVGGTVGTTFMPIEGDKDSELRFAEYQKKYCLDDALVSTLRKQKDTSNGWPDYPYTEGWLSYIWSTGNNWSGPIGTFTLTVDKEDPKSLVSFCGDNVKKTGPTTFEFTETDWYPPYDHELEILLLHPYAESTQ